MKTFRARTMKEAVRAIKESLGPDAVIVATRRMHDGFVEVTATVDESHRRQPIGDNPGIFPLRHDRRRTTTARPMDRTSSRPGATPAPRGLDKGTLTPWPPGQAYRAQTRKPVPPDHGAEPAVGKGMLDALEQEVLALRREIRHLAGLVKESRDMLSRLDAGLAERRSAGDAGVSPELEPLRAKLVDAGFPGDAVAELMAQVGSGLGEPAHLLAGALAGRILVSRPGAAGPGPKVIALVGPTGVGKTATIAKLAARAALGAGERTAIVCLDSTPTVQVEQLRRYTEILQIPFAVPEGPDQFHDLLSRFRELDVVLVDTTGRSPTDREAISTLEPYLRADPSIQVHLVVEAGLPFVHMERIAAAFEPCGVGHLILAKVDEGGGVGGALELSWRRRIPLSFVTTGQRVPEDMEEADVASLVQAVMEPQRFLARLNAGDQS